MPRIPHRTTGLLLILTSACAFGGSGAAAKPLMEAGISPLNVVWLRGGGGGPGGLPGPTAAPGAARVLPPALSAPRPLPRRRPGLVLGFGLSAVVGCQGLSYASLALIP